MDIKCFGLLLYTKVSFLPERYKQSGLSRRTKLQDRCNSCLLSVLYSTPLVFISFSLIHFCLLGFRAPAYLMIPPLIPIMVCEVVFINEYCHVLIHIGKYGLSSVSHRLYFSIFIREVFPAPIRPPMRLQWVYQSVSHI